MLRVTSLMGTRKDPRRKGHAKRLLQTTIRIGHMRLAPGARLTMSEERYEQHKKLIDEYVALGAIAVESPKGEVKPRAEQPPKKHQNTIIHTKPAEKAEAKGEKVDPPAEDKAKEAKTTEEKAEEPSSAAAAPSEDVKAAPAPDEGKKTRRRGRPKKEATAAPAGGEGASGPKTGTRRRRTTRKKKDA